MNIFKPVLYALLGGYLSSSCIASHNDYISFGTSRVDRLAFQLLGHAAKVVANSDADISSSGHNNNQSNRADAKRLTAKIKHLSKVCDLNRNTTGANSTIARLQNSACEINNSISIIHENIADYFDPKSDQSTKDDASIMIITQFKNLCNYHNFDLRRIKGVLQFINSSYPSGKDLDIAIFQQVASSNWAGLIALVEKCMKFDLLEPQLEEHKKNLIMIERAGLASLLTLNLNQFQKILKKVKRLCLRYGEDQKLNSRLADFGAMDQINKNLFDPLSEVAIDARNSMDSADHLDQQLSGRFEEVVGMIERLKDLRGIWFNPEQVKRKSNTNPEQDKLIGTDARFAVEKVGDSAQVTIGSYYIWRSSAGKEQLARLFGCSVVDFTDLLPYPNVIVQFFKPLMRDVVYTYNLLSQLHDVIPPYEVISEETEHNIPLPCFSLWRQLLRNVCDNPLHYFPQLAKSWDVLKRCLALLNTAEYSNLWLEPAVDISNQRIALALKELRGAVDYIRCYIQPFVADALQIMLCSFENVATVANMPTNHEVLEVIFKAIQYWGTPVLKSISKYMCSAYNEDSKYNFRDPLTILISYLCGDYTVES